MFDGLKYNYKISDANQYINMVENLIIEKNYDKALEYLNKAYFNYLETYGNSHPKSIEIFSKITDLIKLRNNNNLQL